MRRSLYGLGFVALAAIGVGAFIFLQPSPAQDHGDRIQDQKPVAQLPVSQVILFSSGVGYFQREGDVTGDARVDLTFPVTDINDLLKSLVLQDMGKGKVSAVSYDSHDPIDKTLRSFALNLTNNPTFGELLNQARGEKVEVTTQVNAIQPSPLTGIVIGMEVQKQPVGKDTYIEVDMLNLLGADGLRSVPLSQVQRVRFLNPLVDAELRRAFEVLAMSHDTQKKSVSLHFTGEGKRQVRVGYVVENPIWKTSYRLRLDKDDKPYLQGWAVVENTSDDDWSAVKMTLVSGRPISFQMDMYQPLYIPRPTVEPELFASLRPPTYSGAMDNVIVGIPPPGNVTTDLDIPLNDRNYNRYKQSGGSGANPAMGRASGGFGMGGQGNNAFNNPNISNRVLAGVNADNQANSQQQQLGMNSAPAQQRLNFQEFEKRRNEMVARNKDNAKGVAESIMNIRQGVSSAATAEEIGDYFQYAIDQKVSLPRQKSAMLPIVNKDIEGTKVSIFNESTHPKFPLLGLKLKNTSGQHLMQGPIAVYEAGSYAGDSRLMDLQPNEERLISYAIDLGTEVKAEGKGEPDQLTAAKIVKGVMHVSHKLRMTRNYLVKNRSTNDKKLLIEHPLRPDWKLVTPTKPTERTRDVYRFELAVAAGKDVKQEVVEEQTRVSQIAINSLDDESVKIYLKSAAINQKVKDAIEKVQAAKFKLARTRAELAELQTQLTAISTDQVRLRANLKELPTTSGAYKKSLEKMDKQETEIDKLQADVKRLKEQEKEDAKGFDVLVVELTVE